MKICHIITTLVYGGAERVLVDLANIQIQDHQVDIIYLKGEPKFLPQFKSAINVHYAGGIKLNTINKLRELLLKIDPDIVHTHLGHADFLGLLASHGMQVRRFCTMQNTWFKWDWRDKLIFWGYDILFNSLFPDTHVIGCMDSVSAHIKQRLHVRANRVHTIRNSLPSLKTPLLDKSTLRKKLNIPKDAFCILFVGRLRIQKSVDTLLRATKRLQGKISNFTVILIGEGKEYQEYDLKRLCTESALDEIVEFRGVTSNPSEYMAAADIFVLPSVFEGLPLVMLEAMRGSLPIIASDIEGTNEIIRDGIDGVLFPAKDDEQLAEKIFNLYKDPALRIEVGSNGYQRYKDEFTIEWYAQRMENLYTNNFSE